MASLLLDNQKSVFMMKKENFGKDKRDIFLEDKDRKIVLLNCCNFLFILSSILRRGK